MRIDPNNSIQPHLDRQQPQAISSSELSAADPSVESASVDIKSLNNLLQMIASSSEIRESVVNDVKAKIQAGEYLAKASTYATADAILNL